MEITEFTDYRDFLKHTFREMRNRDRSFSMRNFAKQIHISPQMLSQVINRKKALSTDKAAEVASRLQLSSADAAFFSDLVTLTHSSNEAGRKIARYRIQQRISTKPQSKLSFKGIEKSIFEYVSHWYYAAILELSLTTHFKTDPRWIANRLGISQKTAASALTRLKALNLLVEDDSGRLIKKDFNIAAAFEMPSSALRNLAGQLLKKANEALEEQSISERDITNITMSIDPTRLPEARRMIRSFTENLCLYLEQGNRTEVYAFTPALFKLSK